MPRGEEAAVAVYRAGLGRLHGGLVRGLHDALARHSRRLDGLGRALHAVGPLATLGRGYAILRDSADGRVLRSVAGLAPGTPLLALLADGEADLGVIAVRPLPAPDRG